jgi:multidrug efflux pump subunit AcrB
MLATLVLAFRSFALAGLLLVVAGVSVGFGLLATWLAGFPLSFNTLLGIAGLIGVALNDSIVVLAAIRGDERARSGDLEAVLGCVRGAGRHVVSTTLTTIGGFLPLLVFTGGDFWPPLAIVLAGGVGGATLLAVLFTPGAYLWATGARARRRAAPVGAPGLITGWAARPGRADRRTPSRGAARGAVGGTRPGSLPSTS